MSESRLIYTPRSRMPMRIVAFASGSGGNLRAALNLSSELPDLLEVGLVVTDRPGITAIDIARAHGVPVLVNDFGADVGRKRPPAADLNARTIYDRRARQFHDRVLDQIERHEATTRKRFDIVVLAYRRLIQGRLLEHFADRIVNQHPADLALLDTDGRRAYTGISGLRRSLENGALSTRTSTILIDEGEDTGEILCRGPSVRFTADKVSPETTRCHEQLQKRHSDWPALRFVLRALAEGRYSLRVCERHPDGRRVVDLDGHGLSYGGWDMDRKEAGILR